jgi:hypothetical protein
VSSAISPNSLVPICTAASAFEAKSIVAHIAVKQSFSETRADGGERAALAVLTPQNAEPDAAAVRVACMHDQAHTSQVGPEIPA